MAPVTLYLVHHPACSVARKLSKEMYQWFRLSDLSGALSGAGIPVYFRSQILQHDIAPAVEFRGAELNVIVLFIDEQIVVDPTWRTAVIRLVEHAQTEQPATKSTPSRRSKGISPSRSLVLPVALHDSSYRLAPIYQKLNSIRLLNVSQQDDTSFFSAVAMLRRYLTGSIAREMRGPESAPLKVFLSHAKRDGREIAESIRDDIRSVGQFEAWYDANDLPYGKEWEETMQNAVKEDTAAMIAVRTDAYPTRPWCRREAQLARTPRFLNNLGVWAIQPTVAIDVPGPQWSSSVPMLSGVHRIGWDQTKSRETTSRIVDRLVLETLVGQVHRKVASRIMESPRMPKQKEKFNKTNTCLITWVPDVWTLSCVRSKMKVDASNDPSKIKYIVFPGYGLTRIEKEELKPVLSSFHADTELLSFEEVMS